MVNIPPITSGPRIRKDQAIQILIGEGFTKLEAVLFLQAKTAANRSLINCRVQKRIKEA